MLGVTTGEDTGADGGKSKSKFSLCHVDMI